MPAGTRLVRVVAGILSFACGSALLPYARADDQEELRRALRELQLRQLELRQKAQPKDLPKVAPAPSTTGTTGVVARLGDSRLRHAGTPTCVVFAPDGKRVITGGQDGALRAWDVATGEQVHMLHLPSNPVTAVRFTHGGTKLAAQFSDGQIRFLAPETLKQTATFPNPTNGHFAVSGDGALVAAIGPTGLVVTEVEGQLPKLELPASTRFAFHPDNRRIAVADRAGKVTLYLLAGGKPLAVFDHGGPLNGLLFRADGKQLATGGGPNGTIKVWDVTETKDAKPVAEIEGASDPRAWIGADRMVALKGFAVGIYDLTAKKWTAEAKGIAGEWAVSADGKTVAATGTGGLRVRLWDLASGKQLHADNDTFPDAALLAPTPDGRGTFIIAGDTAFLWPTGKPAATALGTFPGKALVAAVGGKTLAVAVPEGVLVYDRFDPTKPLPAKPTHTIATHAANGRSVAVSPDGKRIAYSGDEVRIVLADAATGAVTRVLPTQTIGLALAFTPDGQNLVVLGRDGFLRMWAAGADETEVWKVRIPRVQKATVAVSPDGKLVAASASGVLKVVDAADGKEAFSIDRVFEDGLFLQAAFSPNGRLLITGSDGATGAMQVWEVATRSLVHRYTTGYGAVTRIGMFPDGGQAITAGAEEVVTVWDLTFRHGKPEPKAEELLTAWADLAALEGAKGYPATRTLAAGGAKAVRIVETGLDEAATTRKTVTKLVKQLGAEEFDDREAASKELLALGIRALADVKQAAATAESAEVRTRASAILDKFNAKGLHVPAHGLAGDMLRLVRAVQVLEDIGGPEAKAVLERIAALGGRPADDARAALKRLGTR